MSAILQIRDLPDEVHRTLKSRAAAAGLSMSEYVRRLLASSAARPTPTELAARIEARGHVDLGESAATAVRTLRDHGE
jgi:plasmid stability protein